jgi:uroporphyrinogen-III synthase
MTTVVLTRPEAHSQRLALALSRHGYASLVMPLMTVQPIADSERSPVPDLTEGAVCIFISANAVQHGLPHIASALAQRASAVLIAVGQQTQSALQAAGFPAITPDQADTEGLLALPALSAGALEQALIVKGEGGRALLASELRRRGVAVNEWSCYRRCWPSIDLSPLSDAGRQWIFQASSGEILSRLVALISEASRLDLLQHPVIVPSKRIARLATELGWHTVLCSDNASDEAVIATLHQQLTYETTP